MIKLIFDKEVEKFIKKQDTVLRRRIRDALLALAENPYQSSEAKQVKGKLRQFRKRVGDYRTINEIVDHQSSFHKYASLQNIQYIP